jgi:hypothetical protein
MQLLLPLSDIDQFSVQIFLLDKRMSSRGAVAAWGVARLTN